MGYYGRPQGETDPKIRKKIIGNEKPIECRPAALLPPQLEELKKEADNLGIIRKERDLPRR